MYNSYLLLKGVIDFLSICWLLSRRTIIHVRVHSIRMELVARKRSYRLVFVSRRRVAAVWRCANVEVTRIVECAARWRCLRVFVDRTVLRCLKIKKNLRWFQFFFTFSILTEQAGASAISAVGKLFCGVEAIIGSGAFKNRELEGIIAGSSCEWLDGES